MDDSKNIKDKNVLTFWSELVKFIEVDDLDGFKKHLSINYNCVDNSKYATAFMFAGENTDFLQHLIFDCGLNRDDIDNNDINPISDKIFIAKELLTEINSNKVNIKRNKV